MFNHNEDDGSHKINHKEKESALKNEIESAVHQLFSIESVGILIT